MQFPELIYPFDYSILQIDKDISIAYTDEGGGKETLIFIHGLASYMPAWRRLVPILADKFRCITIDLPGYGKSAAGVHSGSMIYYAEIISKIIGKLNLGKVSLVGHSMGGQIGIVTALSYPDFIDNLLLLAPAGFEIFTENESELLKTNFTPEYYESSTDQQIHSNYSLNFFEMPVETEAMISDRIRIKSYVNFKHYCSVVSNSLSGMLDYPVYEKLKNISQPVLVLSGKNDKLIPNGVMHKNLSPEIVAANGAAQIKNCKVEMIDNCGHFIPFEKPRETASSIIKFMSRDL